MTVRTASLMLLKRRVRGGRVLLVLAGIIAFPSAVRADDCSFTSPTDCYDQMMVAVLVIAALALLIAFGLELFAAAAALEAASGAGAVLAGEAGEVAGGAQALAEADEVTVESTSRIPYWLDRIRGLNWFEGDHNCVPLARALTKVIAGSDAELFPIVADEGSSLRALATELGSCANPSSFADIVSQLEAAGPGSQGIVNVSSGMYSHVFNVVNDGGEIIFMDSQQIAASTDGAAVAAASNYGAGSLVRFILIPVL